MLILFAGGFLDEPSGRAERQIHLKTYLLFIRKHIFNHLDFTFYE